MRIEDAGPARIKTSADLAFPEYFPKAKWLGRLLRSKAEHHQAISVLIPLVQQSFRYDCDSVAKRFPKEDNLDRYLDAFDYCEEESGRLFIRVMQLLEEMKAETLTFVADSYNRAATTQHYEHVTSAINELYYSRKEGGSHDINTMVKNAVAYSSYSGEYYRSYNETFDDVRSSSPELNRPDLYNLTDAKQEWAVRVMEVARFSREHIRDNEDGTCTTPHMNPELALLLQEDSEWVARTKRVMHDRWLNASQVTPELMRAFYTEGARPLSEGCL